VTHDVSHLTCADFLRAPGVQTPVIVRFSTVIHERGRWGCFHTALCVRYLCFFIHVCLQGSTAHTPLLVL
jgi:Catalase